MSAAAIVALVVVIIVVAAVIAAATLMRGGKSLGGVGLRHRFGPEYERALAHHDGDPKATRHELAQRVKRYGRLELRPLSAQDVERFEARWDAVKGEFVDDPSAAVASADRLIGQLAEKRGFPESESPEHNDALSVHHPHELQAYRRAHELTGQAAPQGAKGTEDLRQTLVAAREMVDALLGTPATTAPPTGTVAGAASPAPATVPPVPPAPAAGTGTRTGEDAPAPESTGDGSGDDADAEPGEVAGEEHRRSSLGGRLAALTGAAGSHKDRTDARS